MVEHGERREEEMEKQGTEVKGWRDGVGEDEIINNPYLTLGDGLIWKQMFCPASPRFTIPVLSSGLPSHPV